MESFAIGRPLPSSLSGATLLRRCPVSSLPPPSAAPLSLLRRPLRSPLRPVPVPVPVPLPRRQNPSLSTVCAASSPEKAPKPSFPPSPAPPQGAKLLPLAISLAIGLAVRFLVPRPVEVTPQAWQLLAIFLSTIAGLVLSPLPVGAWAFIGLTASVVTKTLSFSAAFGAFTNEVIWLIVISFFFARGFVKTGLGEGEGEGEGDGDGDGDGEGTGEGEGDGDGIGDGEGESTGEGTGEGEGGRLLDGA